MKTLLIPVDFTPTSDNAVAYATEWAKAYEYERIILLKTMYGTMFDNLVPHGEIAEREWEEAEEKLAALKKQVSAAAGSGIKVVTETSDLPLVRAIMDTVEDESPELIAVGSDNYDYSSNSFIGGNVISIAKISPVRVLIIPSHSKYKTVEQALVPCDFNVVESLDKLDSYQAGSKLWKEKKLLVLNIDPAERYLRPDDQFKKAEAALHEYLKNFQHQVYYSSNKNIINGILDFCTTHAVQIVIALPRRHSFLYSLTHKSISEAIYRNAMEPILILK